MKKIVRGLMVVALVIFVSSNATFAKNDNVKRDGSNRVVSVVKYHKNGHVRQKYHYRYVDKTTTVANKMVVNYNKKGQATNRCNDYYNKHGQKIKSNKKTYSNRHHKKRYEIKTYRSNILHHKKVYHYNKKGKLRTNKKW